jgi:hypothetical protein
MILIKNKQSRIKEERLQTKQVMVEEAELLQIQV